MDDDDIKELFYIRQKFRDNGVGKLKLMNDHESFYNKYEKCFDMVCDFKCDDTMLNNIINARKSVISGNLSQHNASVLVGEKLVDKYVKPRISKID